MTSAAPNLARLAGARGARGGDEGSAPSRSLRRRSRAEPSGSRARRRASSSTTRRTASPTRRCGCSSRSRSSAASRERRDAMFAGERINVTEDRSVLHVALRMPRERSLVVDGVDVVAEVHEVLDRMAAFCDAVRSGDVDGLHRAAPIRNVVNIGIGGSDLGPVMAYRALRHYSRRDLTFRFVSNVDGTDFAEATRDLDPARDAVHRLLEDVHDARDDDERRHRASSGCSTGSAATRRRSPATSSPSRRTSRAWPRSGSIPPTRSGSGTGSAAATRWTRRSGSRRCSRSARKASRGCSRASTRWTSTSGRRRSPRTCPC